MNALVVTVTGLMAFFPPTALAELPSSSTTPARTEFQKYARQIVGRPTSMDADGTCRVEGTPAVFAIGPGPLIDALVAAGRLSVPSELGDDGYLLRSVEDGNQQCVVILGGSPRGTLYGVYRYLEQFCRVGFFWDGEYIPTRSSLPVGGIDVVERPYWPVRQYLMDCEYTSYWWDWEQWRAEVDWAAKHRFNTLSSNFDFTATWRAVWQRFGVEVPPASLSAPPFHPWAGWHNWAMRPAYPVAYQDFQAELAKRFTDYGRSLGLQVAPDFHGFLGQVPREFAEAFRDRARFLEVGWVGFDPPGVFLHPKDPLYLQVARAFAEEFYRRFGSDHLWPSQTYCEMRPGADPQETLAIEIAVAQRNLEAIRSVDPRAVLFTNSWTFLDRTPEDTLAFLDSLPAEAFQVWEMPSDLERRPPMYQQYDYYRGKPWLVGFLYAYGGTTMLHGDLADMVQRARAAATDPRAAMCRGLCIQPEAIHHNPLAFDLLSRLAWDPTSVELSAFLEDYAERRYGTDAAPGMVRCLRELTGSVYGSPGVLCPLYMLRITAERTAGQPPYGVDQARQFLPHLQAALEIALAESGRVGHRALWERDLIDMTRQFLSDRFNLQTARLVDAYRSGDPEDFRREADVLRSILTSQERLLSSSHEFCLAPLIAKAKALPHAPADMDERIRDILTIWAGRILDYAHRDYYELVRFYYRKRVEAFLAEAAANLAAQQGLPNEKQMDPIYREIEYSFVREPFVSASDEQGSEGPEQVVREVVTSFPVSDARRD